MNAIKRNSAAGTAENSKRHTLICNSIQQVQISTLDITSQEEIVKFSKDDCWFDKEKNLRIVGYNSGKPIYAGTLIGDSITGNLKRHGIFESEDGSLEPMATDEESEEYLQQMGKIWLIEGQPLDHVKMKLASLRKMYAEDRAAEAYEARRKIITHRTKEDLSALKKQLRTYLIRKNIQIINKGGVPLVLCPGHEDHSASGCLYDKQESPVIYCPVCGRSYDIFNISGLLIGSNNFKSQLADVRQTVGVYE